MKTFKNLSIVLMITLFTLNLKAQNTSTATACSFGETKINDYYALSASYEHGIFLTGGNYTVKEEMAITFQLNANKEYVLLVKGEKGISIEVDGLTIDVEGKVNIKTTQAKTLKVNATCNKKGKLIVALQYIRTIN
jgi:hypothetical protein